MIVDIKPDPVTQSEAIENWRTLNALSDAGERIEFPPGNYSIGRPWAISTDGVDIFGDGMDRTRLRLVGMQGPTVMHGILPAFKGEGITISDFVDIKTIGDGTISGLSPKLHGGRVPLFLTCPMTAWSHADWSNLGAFTLDFGMDIGDGWNPEGSGVICGASSGGKPTPLVLLYSWGALVLSVQTNDGQIHRSRCDIHGMKGVVRFAVQIDFNTGEITWIVGDEFKVAPEPSTIAANSRFAVNDDSPWKFCGEGSSDGAQGDWYAIDADFGFTMIGARISRGIRYAPGRMPRTDHDRFMSMDENTIAFIPFDDEDIEYVMKSRVFGLYYGPASLCVNRGCGLLMGGSAATDYRFPMVHRLNIKDISIEGGGYYGMALALGISINTRIRDCRFSHASTGLGCFKVGSNYPAYMEGSNEVSGNVYGIHLDTCMMKQTGFITFGWCGKSFIYAESSGLEMDELFVTNAPDSSMKIGFYVRGTFIANSILIDNEESVDTSKMDSLIRVDLMPFTGMNVVKFSRLHMAQVPRNASVVTLGVRDGTSTNGIRPGLVDIKSISVDVDRQFRSIYNILSPLWIGNMECAWLPSAADHVIASGKCNVRHKYSIVDDVPADKYWIEGCHFFEFPQRNAGGWRTARCTGTGRGKSAKWTRTRT